MVKKLEELTITDDFMFGAVMRNPRRCKEELDLPLGDEAVKIVLNTKGKVGEITDELKALLQFMDGMEPGSDYTRDLEKAVEEVRADEKWRREYMVMVERDRANRRLGGNMKTVAQIRQNRKELTTDAMARYMLVNPVVVKAIIEAIDTHPDWDDEEVAENIDFG